MNTIEKTLLKNLPNGSKVNVIWNGFSVAGSSEIPDSNECPIQFQENNLATLVFNGLSPVEAQELSMRLAPLFHVPKELSLAWHQRMLRVLEWIFEAQQKFSSVADWIGIYQKESALFGGQSTDLLVGPYLGDVTDHVRIPMDRGICGLAMREERLVNVRDVSSDSRHIACSWKTKSELVVPLTDLSGCIIAELDIDSHKLNAFNEEIETAVHEYCAGFPIVWGGLQ